MSFKKYVTSLEQNAMILGIVILSMKDFAIQIIRHINAGGLLHDAWFAARKKMSVRNLKNIATDGAALEKVTALNATFIILGK